MDIVEEVVRRKQTIALDHPEQAYSELRDLLERRMVFDEVHEDKYFHDLEDDTIRSKIITAEHLDKHTREELEIHLYISKNSRELDIQVKGKLVTHYKTEGWRSGLWYYAYRSLYDKFLYGEVRHGYEHSVEEKADELLHRVRQSVGAE